MLKSSLLHLKTLLYRGKIQSALTYLGLNDRVRPVWHKLLMASVGDTTTLCINENNISFRTTTFRQHSRISSLVGEEKVVDSFLKDLQDGDVFFDVGANIGLYSCLAISSGYDIHSVAFEPHSDNISRLTKNLSLNGESWTCCQAALGGSNRLVSFNIASERAGESRHSVSEEEGDVNILQVTCDTLIDRGELPKPSIIKIDVEGVELSVLEGLENSLNNVRVVYCEIHEGSQGKSDIEQFLRDHGYEIEIIQRDEHTYHIRAS